MFPYYVIGALLVHKCVAWSLLGLGVPKILASGRLKYHITVYSSELYDILFLALGQALQSKVQKIKKSIDTSD